MSFGALGMKILDPGTSMTVIDEYDVGTSENESVNCDISYQGEEGIGLHFRNQEIFL